MNGVAITTSSEVAKFAHTSSGSRKKLMPGARIVMIVTRKLSAVMIDEAPANCTPTEKKVWPTGAVSESGAYAVQPSANAPPGARKLQQHHDPGQRQQPEGERVQAREGHVRARRSSAGSRSCPRPAKTGITNRKISSVACTENRPLKVFALDEVRARLRQLRAHQHRQQPADQQEDERVDRVLDADHLVIGVDAEVVLPACRRRGRSGPPGASGARPPSRTSSRSRRCPTRKASGALISETVRIASPSR